MTSAELQATGRAALAGAGGMALLAVMVCAVMGAWLAVTALLIVLAVVVALWVLLDRRAQLEVQQQNEIPRPAAAKHPREEWLP